MVEAQTTEVEVNLGSPARASPPERSVDLSSPERTISSPGRVASAELPPPSSDSGLGHSAPRRDQTPPPPQKDAETDRAKTPVKTVQEPRLSPKSQAARNQQQQQQKKQKKDSAPVVEPPKQPQQTPMPPPPPGPKAASTQLVPHVPASASTSTLIKTAPSSSQVATSRALFAATIQPNISSWEVGQLRTKSGNSLGSEKHYDMDWNSADTAEVSSNPTSEHPAGPSAVLQSIYNMQTAVLDCSKKASVSFFTQLSFFL